MPDPGQGKAKGLRGSEVSFLAAHHPGPPSQTTQACSAQGHSSVTTPRVAPAPAPWGKAPLEHDSAVPSMAASFSAQGFPHAHAHCPPCTSFPGDQPSPDTPPCPPRTPEGRRKGGQSVPQGICHRKGKCASLRLLSDAPHLQMEKLRPAGIQSQAQGQAVNLRKSQDCSWQKVYPNGKGLASQPSEGRERCFLKNPHPRVPGGFFHRKQTPLYSASQGEGHTLKNALRYIKAPPESIAIRSPHSPP